MAQAFHTNLPNVIKHYIKALKVPVTETSLKESLEQNPYYPSLYSISNVFDTFRINNNAYSINEASLDEFKPPFITYCINQNTGKDFVLVIEMTASHVSYISNSNEIKKLNRQDFVKQWQKIVFVAEVNSESGEKDYKSKLKSEKSKLGNQFLLSAGIVILVGLMVYLFVSNVGKTDILSASGLVLIKLLGVGVTLLLAIYEIDKSNSLVKNMCTAGKQINCDAVLTSKGAKVLGMKWGEVGFFYFAATAIFLVFPGLSFQTKLPWLGILSTLVAPYVFFSLYYQWKIVKQWCLLCLFVQTLLGVELVWSIVNFWSVKSLIIQPIGLSAIMSLLICVLLPMTIWFLIKPIAIKARESSNHYSAYKRLLYHPEIFNSLLQQQMQAPDGWQGLGLNLGNPNAKNTIIKVCNPYCGPCAKAHPALEEIIKQNTDIKVKMIFSVTNTENDNKNKTIKHLLAIASKGDLHLTERALDDWYLAEKKDYETFASKYPMNGELKEQEDKLVLMKNWCEEAEIIGTPTIYINGKRLPETYSINELKNIF